MDLQPLLENELVQVRPLVQQDLEPLFAVAKDPKIWEQHPSKRYLRAEFDTFFEESIKSGGALTLVDKKSGAIIGSSRFKKVEGFSKGIEIGWTFLSRDYWGGTYNKAVKDLMIAHAFKYVDNILFYIAKDNIRSQKAVEKIKGQNISESNTRSFVKKKGENKIYLIKKPL